MTRRSRSASGSSGCRAACQPWPAVQSSTTSVAKAPRGSRLRAHERVARPRLAAGGRGLEQKCERTTPQLGERRDGRVGIEQQLAPHGHERRRAAASSRNRSNVTRDRSRALVGRWSAGDIRKSCFELSRLQRRGRGGFRGCRTRSKRDGGTDVERPANSCPRRTRNRAPRGPTGRHGAGGLPGNRARLPDLPCAGGRGFSRAAEDRQSRRARAGSLLALARPQQAAHHWPPGHAAAADGHQLPPRPPRDRSEQLPEHHPPRRG